MPAKHNIFTMHKYLYATTLTFIILILGITSILISHQSMSANLNTPLNSGTPLQFSDLYFSLNETSVSFPSGGYIVPVYRQQQLIGCALFGNGNFNYGQEQAINECYILLNETLYSQLLSSLYLLPSQEITLSQRALNFAQAAQKYEQVILSPTGFKFLTLPDDEAQLFIFESNTSTCQPQEVYPATPFKLMLNKSYIALCLGYLLILLAFIGLALTLTSRLGYTHTPYHFFIAKPSLQDYKWHLGAIMLGGGILHLTLKNDLLTAIYQVVTLIALFIIARKRNVPNIFMRTDLTKNLQGIPLGLLCGFLLYICTNPTFPKEMSPLLNWLKLSLLTIWIPTIWGIVIAYGFILYELESLFSEKVATSSLIIALSIVTTIYTTIFCQLGSFTIILNLLIFQPLLFLLLLLLIKRTNSLSTGIICLALSFSLNYLFI